MNGKPSAINVFFLFFVATSILLAAYNGTLKEVTDASFDAAKGAVTLSIGLIGIMALWLGFVRILEAGGFMLTLAKLVRPLIKKLFPEIPDGHPAMGAMLLNISANMLGLGNAATPLGIKAIKSMQKKNKDKNKLTDSMAMFIVINTASLQLIPTTVIAIRNSLGAKNPTEIIFPVWFATICAAITAIFITKICIKRSK